VSGDVKYLEMTSEKVRSYQPTLGRMRSAVGIRTATQPLSLGGVVEGAVEKKPRTSDRDVAESVAVSADVSDSPNDVTQRHRRRRLRTSKMLSRHHADGRLSSDIAAEVDNTVSSVACAPCNEGEGDLLVCTKQTSKSTLASKPKKTEQKAGTCNFRKTFTNHTAHHRRKNYEERCYSGFKNGRYSG